VLTISSLKQRRAWLWLRVMVTHVAVVFASAVILAVATVWVADHQLARSEVADWNLTPTRDGISLTTENLDATRLRIDRATSVLTYAEQYGIDADLSQAIYDIALEEGIHPALAFRLVRVESRFRPHAVSSKGAIGYTQVRLATARGYDPEITETELAERDTNLRLGFRYLRDMLKRYRGDLSLALLAYNRGPTAVDSIRTEGGDPANGYARVVMRGVRNLPWISGPRKPTGS